MSHLSPHLAPILHTEIAPSGVIVVSEVPFIEPRWWDRPRLHFIWSYASWTVMILDAYRIPSPRRWFDNYSKR